MKTIYITNTDLFFRNFKGFQVVANDAEFFFKFNDFAKGIKGNY